MTISRDKVIQGLDFVGDIAMVVGKLNTVYAKPAMAVGLVLKGVSKQMKVDEDEDLDSILAKVRMPRKLVLDWTDIVDSSNSNSITDMATPSAKAVGKVLKDE